MDVYFPLNWVDNYNPNCWCGSDSHANGKSFEFKYGGYVLTIAKAFRYMFENNLFVEDEMMKNFSILVVQSRLHLNGLTRLAIKGVCSHCTESTDNNLALPSITLSTILSCRVSESAPLCLLGVTSDVLLPSKFKNLLLISLTVTKKVVLQNLKSSCHSTSLTGPT